MRGAKFISKRKRQRLHLIIICDEAGIFDAFELLINQLTYQEQTYLSLIYIVAGKNIHTLFERELRILEKRFSDKLLLYLVKHNDREQYSKQEIIEAIINSNTFPKMQFSVFGMVEFVNSVSEILRFLNVKTTSIDSKTI